ncbi:hypothetical protein Patl1_11427 [Pistacia atlantica]|uniref:Uncharacterized protein n=1 Tax=Pistacia atlantica TaxID=434234 RepID=A0ACC1A8C6_9ROSI|nr:hypothetical protein Patl1_11427 [Pistacia atlantica]
MMLRVTVEINNDSFRLFYDCSSAGASHIYFQGCYFPNHLPVELMHVDTFFSDGQKGIRISTVTDYPIKTLLFEHTCNIKIMVEKQTTSSNLSAWECGGYFLFRSKYEFDQVTEEAMLIHLSTVSLDDAGFEAVKQLSGSIASKLVI